MTKVLNKVKSFFAAIGRATKEEFVGTWKGFSKEKTKPLTLVLTIINVVCLLLSNILAVKTVNLFSIGEGAKALQFAVPAAILLFPVVTTVSDLLAQIDYIWTRRSCHIGFIMNLFMVLAFTLGIYIPGFINGNPDQGTSGAMNTILGSTWFLLIASLVSFYVGDLANDLIFKKMRKKGDNSSKSIFNRCIVSTIFGQLLDSSIFISLGLYIFPKLVYGKPFIGYNWDVMSYGPWNGWAAVLMTILFQVAMKIVYEILLSPLVIYIIKKVDKGEEVEATK